MAKSGGGGGTTISKTEPWDEAKPFFTKLYQQAEEAYKNTNKTPFTGSLVTRPNANNLAAQSMLSQFIPNGAASWAPPGQPQAAMGGSRPLTPRPALPVSPALQAFLAQNGGQ